MTLKIAEFKKNLTVIVLCGGKGQRLRPLTTQVPKPLIRIKKKTILEYILNHLLKFKINNIIIASGYKNRLIKNFVSKKYNDKIEVIDTGINAGILDRIKKII